MINKRKYIKYIWLSLMCLIVLGGCASGRGDDAGDNTEHKTKYQPETSREQIREEETTTRKHGEGPTASVIPNDGAIEETTVDNSSNGATKPASKPSDTTKPSDNTNEQATTDAEKETTDTNVPEKPFYMSKSEFSVQEMSYTRLQFYIKNNPGDIVWESDNPSVAQVVNDEIIGIYEGTTTITGTSGETSVDITVNVIGGVYSELDINTYKITLFEGEEYRLIATRKDAVFTSTDSEIATVSEDGIVKGVKAGKATIVVKNDDYEVQCSVEIVADDGSYLDVNLDTEYNILTERTFMSSDRIYLFMDAGTQVDDGIMDKLENILDEIEAVTDYSFTDTSDNVEYSDTRKRVVIQVVNSEYDTAYSSTDGIVISPYDISLEEYGAHVLVHELIHVVQARNGVDIGIALTEGYAEYLQAKVCEKLNYQTTYDAFYNQSAGMSQFGEITAENIENKLLYPEDIHPLSYFFVEYIAKTYGDSKLKALVEAISLKAVEMHDDVMAGQSSLFSEEEILAIIEENTADSLIDNFYAYYSSLELRDGGKVVDLSGYEEYAVQFEGTGTDNYLSIWGTIICDGSIILDYTEAIDYASKVWGRKCKAVYLYGADGATITAYDMDGNEVQLEEIQLENTYLLAGYGVVKIKIEGVNTFEWHSMERYMFS